MFIISFDPGVSGGICVLDEKGIVEIYKMPVIAVKAKIGKKQKTTTTYDLVKIYDLLRKYSSEDVLMVIERVSTRPGEGTVSSFNFGMGYGSIIALSVVIAGKNPTLISPQTWKKHFKEFKGELYDELKQDIKLKKEKIKEIKSQMESISSSSSKAKNIKDKESKKRYKDDIKNEEKEINKLNAKVKRVAKTQARLLCKKMFPDITKEFDKIGDDGKADAVLIGIYARDNVNELVSTDI